MTGLSADTGTALLSVGPVGLVGFSGVIDEIGVVSPPRWGGSSSRSCRVEKHLIAATTTGRSSVEFLKSRLARRASSQVFKVVSNHFNHRSGSSSASGVSRIIFSSLVRGLFKVFVSSNHVCVSRILLGSDLPDLTFNIR